MADHSTDDTNEEGHEQSLDRLLRMLNKAPLNDLSWPPEDTIVAYIRGDATDEQRNLMQELLARSQDFRSFVVETAELLSAAEAPEAQKAFDHVRVPSLERVGQLFPKPTPRRLPQIRTALSRLLRPRVLVPVLSAAAALVLMIRADWFSPNGEFVGQSRLTATSKLTPSVFATFTSRGTTHGDPRRVYQEPDSAALDAFRSLLTYDWVTGRIEITQPADTVSSNRQIRTRLIDSLSGGTVSADFRIPSEWDPILGRSPDLELWVLNLTDLRLSRATIRVDSPDVIAGHDEQDSLFASITLRTPEGYLVTAAQPFLRSH